MLRDAGESAGALLVEGSGWIYDPGYLQNRPAGLIAMQPVTVTGEFRAPDLSLVLLTPRGSSHSLVVRESGGAGSAQKTFEGTLCGSRLELRRVEGIATGTHTLSVGGAVVLQQVGLAEYGLNRFRLHLSGVASLEVTSCDPGGLRLPGRYRIEEAPCGLRGVLWIPIGDPPGWRQAWFLRTGTFRITKSAKRRLEGELVAVATDSNGAQRVEIHASFSAPCYWSC